MLAPRSSRENGLLYRDGSAWIRPRDVHLSCFSLSISSHLALCSISLLLPLSSKTATGPLGEAVTQLSRSREPNLPSLLVLMREGENRLEQLFMMGKRGNRVKMWTAYIVQSYINLKYHMHKSMEQIYK